MINKRIEREVIRLMKIVDKKQVTEINKLAKRYKKDYAKLDRELRRLFKRYEEEGSINYSQLVYDGLEVKLDYLVAMTTISRYAAIYKATEEVLQSTAHNTIDRMVNIKGIPEIRKEFNTDHLINKDMAGLNWIERTGRNRNDFINSLQTTIKDGLEIGKTYSELSEEVAKQLGTDLYKAERIIRTESMRVMDDAKLEVFREIGKEVPVKKQWMSVRDERVRDAHNVLDGTIVGLEEDFVSPTGGRGKMPRLMDLPQDSVNCRCNVKLIIE